MLFHLAAQRINIFEALAQELQPLGMHGVDIDVDVWNILYSS